MIGRSLVGVAALCAALVPTAAAGPAPSRTIDSTFSCETGYLGGVYQATVNTYRYVPPQASRRIPGANVGTNLTNGFLAGVSSNSIHVNRLYCKVTGAKAPLTTKGLRGGAFSSLPTEFDCFTPRRVLLRIRGDFVKPTTLRAAKPFGYPQLQALGATKRAELAMATLAGRPIAYASIAGAKTTRLFTSTDCQED